MDSSPTTVGTSYYTSYNQTTGFASALTTLVNSVTTVVLSSAASSAIVTDGNEIDAYTDNYNSEYDYEYTEYNYPDSTEPSGGPVEYIYEGFAFEKTIYLYVWGILIIITSLANILVILVLRRKRMRNATNVILIAIAISDSLTGLVTLPAYMYAYSQYIDLPNAKGVMGELGVLTLSKDWCEAFMLIKYFVSRALHTVSIWLTVMLGVQRFVSVSFPFRANSLFSISNTTILIIIISILSPILHIYHTVDRKATVDRNCVWKLDKNCEGGGCVYLWLTFLLMHFLPCVLLVVFSLIMIFTMIEATAKMKRSQMISSPQKLQRRDQESRRISLVVIAVVVVFLIPEIPYGIFLLVTVLLNHSGKELLTLQTSRKLICAYEVLVVLSFHANFWIYLVMNRKFRNGLQRIFDPLVLVLYTILAKFGIHRQIARRQSESSFGKTYQTDVTSHTQMSRSNSLIGDTKPHAHEMKTYHFKTRADSDSKEGHEPSQTDAAAMCVT